MKVRTALAMAALAAMVPAKQTDAAPQLLGLLADRAVPLHCVDGVCTAELTAICLQEARDMPAWETPYRAVQSERIALVGKSADGDAIDLPIGHRLHIESDRGAWAVQISLPETALREHGLSEASLSIRDRVVLAPVAIVGDPSPQTAADIAIAAASFDRPLETVIGYASPDMAAAHIMNDMINALSHIALDTAKPGGDLWRKTFGSDARNRLGMRQAAAYYDACTDPLIYVERVTLRRCLQLGHDDIVTSVNRDFWDAAKPSM